MNPNDPRYQQQYQQPPAGYGQPNTQSNMQYTGGLQVPPAGYSQQPASNFVVRPTHNRSGAWKLFTFIFLILLIGSLGAGAWAYLNYVDQRDNVDSKVTAAVATAVKDQADKDAADYLEKEKEPNRQFAGPSDYGSLSFDYPKTWSVYEAKDATSGGTYEAYFNPGVVPPVSSTQQYALHVTIEDKDYDKVVASYDSLVSKGDLVSSSVKFGEQNGARLDGAFTKDIHGFAVIFKIRDKTVTVRSDAETFKTDFDALIATITFNV